MRDPQTDPAVRRRLTIARYACNHTKAATARHFGCCWKTIQATVQRVAAYEESGQIQVLQNKPRGKSRRTAPRVEDQVIALYQESATPPRPYGRRYSAAKVARLCHERHHQSLHRKTVWAILRRRGVWAPQVTQKRAVSRFERSQPNDLWHIDLIEKEPTAIGEVYGIPVLDDHSRYLLALRFFLTKEAQTTLYTTYLAMHEHGTPAAIMSDHGGQFVDATGLGTTTFQGMLEALGIQPLLISRPQTNGKEERVNQFIERDFLDEVRWQIQSLAELNQRSEVWRHRYNQSHLHETVHDIPAHRYRPGVKVDAQFLKQAFAQDERRKVSREGTVTYHKYSLRVPDQYIGWQVWVSNFFDQYVEIHTGHHIIGTFPLGTFDGNNPMHF